MFDKVGLNRIQYAMLIGGHGPFRALKGKSFMSIKCSRCCEPDNGEER